MGSQEDFAVTRHPRTIPRPQPSCLTNDAAAATQLSLAHRGYLDGGAFHCESVQWVRASSSSRATLMHRSISLQTALGGQISN